MPENILKILTAFTRSIGTTGNASTFLISYCLYV